MSKRKRTEESHEAETKTTNGTKLAKTNGHVDVKTTAPIIQIITGSYERVLHGITASISDLSSKDSASVVFADTFLFNAHASAIRCLAISPLPDVDSTDSQGVFLASGGTDERVNVYSLAAAPTVESDKMPTMPTLGKNKILEDPRNRELGAIMQHYASITALHFPTRSKLLSASEDNTIAITRTKDLTVVSTIKAPHPKVQGQPSGDTAPPGATPAGVNDFSIHPSMKLMISVGKGEKCMRLWNLVTGKKAGVLNFGREELMSVKESKYSSGEGRRVRWSPTGNEFAVAFERGVVIFGEDSKPKSKALPLPLTKLHHVCYIPTTMADNNHLAISTEDGRILFYAANKSDAKDKTGDALHTVSLPDAHLVAQLGGKEQGITGRIKDFEVVALQSEPGHAASFAIVAASSDGSIRIWHIEESALHESKKTSSKLPIQIGKLIGTYETGSRITCLKAFLMQAPRTDEGLSEFEGFTEEGEDLSSDSDSDE
jgi:protein MAK11